ncbi:hypothetical protein SSCHL_0759 [Staphylococcus schleiferi]|nr:hypothetical protein SSCHL_0759 [Staphylococcus schleiferi]
MLNTHFILNSLTACAYDQEILYQILFIMTKYQQKPNTKFQFSTIQKGFADYLNKKK